MKNKRKIIYSLIILTMLLFAANVALRAGNKATNELTVIVTGLKSDKGSVIIKLFNSKESYSAKGAESLKEISAAISDNKVAAKFTNLEPGEYVIKLYHDENDNSIHDKNFIGIPKEDYAFSNNASGTFGPPDYEKAKFELNGDLFMTINISEKNK